MRHSFLHVGLGFVLAGALLAGCNADVDLKNIDPAAKVDMALALPIGEMTATIGDFLGDSTIKGLSIREDGIYQFDYTVDYDRQFHKIDLTQYLSTSYKDLKLVQQGYAAPISGPVELQFPMVLELSNINRDATIDNERLDKMVIETAQFSSVFNNNFGLTWNEIKQIDLLLPPERFSRESGLTVNIPTAGYDFGQEIPIVVDNFTLNLMKDPTKDPGRTNVDSTFTFFIRFKIEPNSPITPDADDAFNYLFSVNFMEYEAIYGIFKESNQMHDHDTIRIADEWPGWNNIKNLHVPFYDPQINLEVTTSVAAPLVATINLLEAEEESTHEKRQAHNFDKNPSQTTYSKILQNIVRATDPLDATATNLFNFGKDNGALDEIVEIRPDIVIYDYNFKTWDGNPVEKQHRLTQDTKIHIKANVKIPFQFNEGTHLSYADTLDVTLKQYSIDSLVAKVEGLDSLTINDLKLVITAQSWIPFDVSGKVFFLDENGNDLGIKINEDNIVTFNGPTDYNGPAVNTPGKSTIVVNVSQEELDKLAKTQQIYFDLNVEDVDVSQLKNKGAVFPVALAEYTKLHVKVALAADVEAYLKLQFN